MKKNYFSAFLLSFCMLAATTSQAQKAFQRGSLMVSISEGSTIGSYKTSGSSVTVAGTSTATPSGMTHRSEPIAVEDDSHPTTSHHHCSPGTRDPLVVEYGITDKISLGITCGNDLFNVKPEFYGLTMSGNKPLNVKTDEVTFDGAYHFYVNKRLDLSAFGAIGHFAVYFDAKENTDSKVYSYKANGGIVRGGVRARYYFYKRLGVFGQVSSYAGKCSPNGVKTNNVGQDYKTQISGSTIEAGLCFRFIR